MFTSFVIPSKPLPSSLPPSGGEVMNTDERKVSLKAWRQLYEAAVLGWRVNSGGLRLTLACFLHTQAMRTVAGKNFFDAFLPIHQKPTSPIPVSTNDIGSGKT